MSQTKTYEKRLQVYAQMHADKKNIVSDPDDFEYRASHCYHDAEVTIAAVAEGIRLVTDWAPKDWQDEYLIQNGYVPKEGKQDGK